MKNLEKACEHYKGKQDSLDIAVICIWALVLMGCFAAWYKVLQWVGVMG